MVANQIVAVVAGKKADAEKALTALYQDFAKRRTGEYPHDCDIPERPKPPLKPCGARIVLADRVY